MKGRDKMNNRGFDSISERAPALNPIVTEAGSEVELDKEANQIEPVTNETADELADADLSDVHYSLPTGSVVVDDLSKNHVNTDVSSAAETFSRGYYRDSKVEQRKEKPKSKNGKETDKSRRPSRFRPRVLRPEERAPDVEEEDEESADEDEA